MGLLEAIEKDLDEFDIKNENELRIYLRYLLSQAYMGTNGNTNTQKYIRNQIIQGKDYKKELKSLVYNGEKILSMEQFFNTISETVLSNYINKKNSVTSLDEAVSRMITYYENNFDKNNLDNIIFVAKQILNNYFVKGLINAFSSKNGTRDYIRNTSKSDLINQMKQKTKLNSSLREEDQLELLISSYANFVGTEYYNKQKKTLYDKNGLLTIKEMIINEIKKSSLNDRQKKYLKEELEKGNIDMLDRYVDPNLLSKYKRLSSESNKHYKM